MNSDKKVLVTGATGFIGSNLTKRLVKEGFDVAIIKRKSSNTKKIDDVLNKLVIYNVDLRETEMVRDSVLDFKPDIIFHLATYIFNEYKHKDIPLIFDANVLGTINLLDAIKDAKPLLFINTSSCFVYGKSKNKLKENSHLSPLNLYALTKLQSEQACNFYSDKYNLNIVTFRIFSAYGPTDTEQRIIPFISSKLSNGISPPLTSGEQKRDFIYIDDIVNAYMEIISNPTLIKKHEIINIGSGNAVSIKDIVINIKDNIDKTIKLKWGLIPHKNNEVWFVCADISKAKRLLNWEPKIQILNGGLKKIIKLIEKK